MKAKNHDPQLWVSHIFMFVGYVASEVRRNGHGRHNCTQESTRHIRSTVFLEKLEKYLVLKRVV
jgi:hypothetical protein